MAELIEEVHVDSSAARRNDFLKEVERLHTNVRVIGGQVDRLERTLESILNWIEEHRFEDHR